MTKRQACEEGLFVGTASGAALTATLSAAEKLKQGVIVVMFPDGGDRYLK
jgi:cysteine synthase